MSKQVESMKMSFAITLLYAGVAYGQAVNGVANQSVALGLSTTGTSGPATYSGGVLNIPQYPGGGAPTLPGTPAAEWLFTETTGTTLADSSGNGKNITLPSTPPALSSKGVVFSAAGQQLLTPITGTYQTAMVCFTHNPGPMYVTNPAYDLTNYFESTPTILGTSVSGETYLSGTDGAARANHSTTTTGFLNPAVVGSAGTGYVASPYGAINGGPHCLIHVRDASSDSFYFDGVLQSNAYTAGTAAYTAVGQIVLGGLYNSGTADTSHWFWGTYHMVVLWTTKLTATQITQAENFASTNLMQRGLPAPGTSSALLSDGVSRLALVGNSITACAALATAANCWNLKLSLSNTALQSNIVRSALGGTTATFMRTTSAIRHEPLMAANAPYNIVLLWDGINDGCRFGNTADQQWNEDVLFAIRQHQLGFKVIIGTMIDDGGGGTCGGGLTPAAYKHAYNNIVSALWSQWFDGMADFGASSILGCDGCSSSATYFYSDHVHPIDAAQSEIASIASAAINRVLANTPAGSFSSINATKDIVAAGNVSGKLLAAVNTSSGDNAVFAHVTPNEPAYFDSYWGNTAGLGLAGVQGLLNMTTLRFLYHTSQSNNFCLDTDYNAGNVSSCANSGFKYDGTTKQISLPAIKATTGTRYVCVDTNGLISSSASPCSGT